MTDNEHKIKQVKNADHQIIFQSLKIMKTRKKYQNIIDIIKKKMREIEKQEILQI